MNDDFLTITWPAITFPTGVSPWMTGDPAQRAQTITVTPTLRCWIQDAGTIDSVLWRDLDLVFDPDAWDTDRFGLVYGSEVFERAVADWFATLGFPEAFGLPFGTESGMQSDTHVSMQLDTLEQAPWWKPWGSMHAALAWIAAGPGGQPTTFAFQPPHHKAAA